MAEDLMHTLFGGLQRVGEAGVDIGKAVASIPVSIATAIPDFVKDPDVFLSGGRLGAVGALLSKDYRQRQKQDLEASRNWDKIVKTKQTMDWLENMFSDRDPNHRQQAALQADQAGVPSEQIDAALGFANQADQKAAIARQGVAAALPDLPPELVAATDYTPNQAVGAIIAARNAAADDARADTAAAQATTRFNERVTPEERNKRRQGKDPEETPAQKFQRELKERGATKAHDMTMEQTAQGLEGPISMISDPAMQGQLRSQVPSFSARQAEKEALKIMEQAIPNNSRKNLAAKKAARLALRAKRKEAEAMSDTAANNPGSNALPTDPAERVGLANQMATDMLGSGMPPEKVVAELLNRGFTVEEIPE